MTVATIDISNIATYSNFFGGSASFNVTCGASDNFLVVITQTSNGPPDAPVSAVSYNGAALTLLQSYSAGGLEFEESIWYLANPTTGSAKSLSVTNTANSCFATAIPMSGVNTSTPFGTIAQNFSSSNNNPALTVVGGTSNDVYICTAVNGDPTSTTTGSNQTNLSNLTFNSIGSFVVDYIPGVDTGTFSWTGSGSGIGPIWIAQGVAIKGLPSSSAAIAWVT